MGDRTHDGSPLAQRLTPEACAGIRAGAREVLAPFTRPDGRFDAPLHVHLVSARVPSS